MKQFISLLVVLPVTACATQQQITQDETHRFTWAQSFCSQHDPSTKSYLQCVNRELDRDGLVAFHTADGSLQIAE